MADAFVRAPLVDQAIAHLCDQIATGRWGVGDRLYPPNRCSHSAWVSAAPPCVKL